MEDHGRDVPPATLAVIKRLPQHAESLLQIAQGAQGLLRPQEALEDLRSLRQAVKDAPQTAFTVLQEETTRIALCQLVAVGVRLELPPSEPDAHARAMSLAGSAAVQLLSTLLQLTADDGALEALDVAVAGVELLLKTQVLHAAARQLASATSSLEPGVRTTGSAGPAAGGPAAVAVPSYRRHLAAQQLDDSCYLLYAMARVVHEARRASATDVLLGALAESRVLDHAGRLMLLITPPDSAQGPTDTSTRLALAVRASAFGALVEACLRLAAVARDHSSEKSTSPSVGPRTEAKHLRDLAAEASDGFEALPLGRCGRYAVLAHGVTALDALDGRGGYGLPQLGCLRLNPATDVGAGPRPGLQAAKLPTKTVQAFTGALSMEHSGLERWLSRRAATALRLRLGRLALASLRAAAGFQRPQPEGTEGVMQKQGEGAEAVAFWRLVVGAALYAAPRLDAGEPLCRHLAGAVQGHIDSTLALPPKAGSIQAGSSAAAPAPAAAALAGGLIPGLEALLRRCGQGSPPAGLVAIADRLLTRQTLLGCFPWALCFQPKQATALVTSVAKLLRRCSKPLEQWPHQAVAGCTAALGGAYMTLRALAPCPAAQLRAQGTKPLAASAFAALRLLPEASRLVREGAAEALAQAGSGSGALSAAAAAAGDGLVELATCQYLHWWLDTLTCAAFAPTSAPPAAAPLGLRTLWTVGGHILSGLDMLLYIAAALAVLVLDLFLRLVCTVLSSATHALWSAALLTLPRRLREAAGPRPPWTPAQPFEAHVLPHSERFMWVCVGRLNEVKDASAVAAAAPEWRRFLEEEVAMVLLLGAVLSLLELRGRKPLPSPSTSNLCVVAAAFRMVARVWPQHVLGRPGTAGVRGRGPRAFPWRPEGLRLLAWHLETLCTGTGHEEAAHVEALAAAIEKGSLRSASAPRVSYGPLLAMATPSELQEFSPYCSNPACINLEGDSEVSLRRQLCKQCGRAEYCCRECQVAHRSTCKGTAAAEAGIAPLGT
ncbi:hypothetical protein HYH03_000442 [Edaphochlamys debaryana]|uniref:MYND-type domain-containing protein n=1 Tax=Edaphochlamys debaryana TaxID=47281 RepID=A0A835YHK7_9CHLO|nr:hypothetical protein HYH03_000442 [Edaphochlamys debaryana]|eukprot:KAG2501944.1 hypothetical protein HYH03_000442 [Edaphochlamys debaryana]